MKKVLNGIAVLLVAIGAGYGITQKLGDDPNVGNLKLANVEALGDGEGSSNYQTGPAEVSRGGLLGNRLQKFCLCENSHYCRESK